MIERTSAGPSVLASFMASAVEFVEALTIVLAVGVVRGGHFRVVRHRRRWGAFIDDGWLAVGILMWTMGARAMQARHPVVSSAGACLLFAAGIPLLLSPSALRRANASATQTTLASQETGCTVGRVNSRPISPRAKK